VLSPDDGHLHLRQVLASGGTFPVSVTVHGDLLYVLNAHEDSVISGYRITKGQFYPIEHSTRSLKLPPATGPQQTNDTPAQVSFTPDGQHLVITTKSHSSIEIFTVGADGRPSDTFVTSPAGTPFPFGFTFDDYDRLVVTDGLSDTLTTYTINPDGTVKLLASEPDGQKFMCWVVHTAGNFYVVDNGTNTITGYHIDQAGKPTVFTRATTRQGPIDAVATRDGQFLYVQLGISGGVDGFRIKSDGTLDQFVTITGPGGMQGIALT
jgi:6-phosphogluconolactonase (cycloisomerase 2 family)